VFASTYSNYGLSENGQPITEISLNPQSLYARRRWLRRIAGKQTSSVPVVFRLAAAPIDLAAHAVDLISTNFVLGVHRRRLIIYQRGYSRRSCMW
jgi:hypothetical protein